VLALQEKEPNILVVGDLMIDHYLYGNCERISPEAPVPIVVIEKEQSILGGAGNVIHNLKTLGALVDIISVVGDDKNGEELKKLLAVTEVSDKNILIEKGRITSKKSRIIASQQQVIRYDKESIEDISNTMQEQIIKTFKNSIEKYEIVIFSDYGKGVLTTKLTQTLIGIANKSGKKILVDPKGSDYHKYKGATLLTPNKKEAIEASGINIVDNDTLLEAISILKNRCELEISLITLNEDGIAIYDDTLRTHPTVAQEVFDVTGAGDTVIASLGFTLALGYDIDKAVEFSNLAAGVVVGKIGSATATLDEIIELRSNL